MDRVRARRAEDAVVRRVDPSGMVSLSNRTRYVGKVHRGKTISVLLDPERREWIFADAGGQQLRGQPVDEISQERIVSLTVTHRH